MASAAPDAVLTAKVAQLQARVRLLVVQRWVIRTLLVAVVMCLLAAAVMRLMGSPIPVEWLPVLLGVAALVGVVVGWTRPVSAMDVARLADQRLALRERLSSGLEFATTRRLDGGHLEHDPTLPGASHREFIAAQIEDAVRHCGGLKPAEVFPNRLPREGRWLAVSAVALLALLILPDVPVFQSPQKRAERAAMEREGKQLERLAKETLKRPAPTNVEVSRRVAENMRRLGIQMQRGRVDKKAAMLRASRMTRELREAQRQLAGPTASKSLAQAAAEMRRAASDPRFAKGTEAGKAMARIAAALEKKELDAAAEALRELARKLKSGQITPDEAAEAAAALSQIAAALEKSDLDAAAKQLAGAARQLEAAGKLAALDPETQARLRRLMAEAGDQCAAAGAT